MKWDKWWVAYFAAVLAAFGTLETLGLRDRNRGEPSGTLTATVRRWFGVHPQTGRRWLCGAAYLVGLVWLAAHILGPQPKIKDG